jgi:hypothetical protein
MHTLLRCIEIFSWFFMQNLHTIGILLCFRPERGAQALEWVRTERGAQALECVVVPAAAGELSMALEILGKRV